MDKADSGLIDILKALADTNTDVRLRKGLCGRHLWGAPAGRDDMDCPYCVTEVEEAQP